MDLIAALQTLCVVLMVVEYTSQITKILKRKTVEDLSGIYWLTKITITLLQFVILIISSNPLKVYLSQLLSLCGCLIIFSMMLYYSKRNKKGD